MEMYSRKNVAGGIAGISFVLAALLVPIVAIWNQYPLAGALLGMLIMVFLYRILRNIGAAWLL